MKPTALIALVGLYVFSSFYRIAVAVIAPQLVNELSIGPEALGLLGGIFFFSFALCQFPLGPMLDRVGPRIVITVFAFIGASGAILFAVAPTFIAALIGRVLLGIGMAAMMMGTLKIFAISLPPNRFSRWTGVLVSIGVIGSVMAASPLAYISELIGWRVTLFSAGILTVLLGILFFQYYGRTSNGREEEVCSSDSSPLTMKQSIKMIMGSLSFWQICAVAFCRYGTFVSLQGVWLALYFIDVASYTQIQAGNMLLLVAVGMALGSPCAGWWYDRATKRKSVVMLGLSFYALTLLPFLDFFEIGHYLWHSVACFLMGFFSGFGMLVYSYAKDSFPAAVSGTAMSWVNFFLMLGGAVFMQVTGIIIGLFPKTNGSYVAGAYHVAFLASFLSVAASLIFFAFPDKKGRLALVYKL